MSDNSPLLARTVQLRGSALARWLLRLAGWRVVFDGLPARQGVLIVYPHTSNWDFVIGVLAKWAIGIPLAFWGKDTLFDLPLFGRWLRWIGGVPVDRNSPQGAVAAMVGRFAAARANDAFLWLALSPEGTRSYRHSWRSGFYQVALQADVPLALAFFDYAERRVGVDSFIRLTGDVERDMAAIESRLGQRRGRKPQLAAPIRLPRT
jgi:1-acyl-sn-glycerol-3-phosphate acyltransferase